MQGKGSYVDIENKLDMVWHGNGEDGTNWDHDIETYTQMYVKQTAAA